MIHRRRKTKMITIRVDDGLESSRSREREHIVEYSHSATSEKPLSEDKGEDVMLVMRCRVIGVAFRWMVHFCADGGAFLLLSIRLGLVVPQGDPRYARAAAIH